MKVDRKHLLEVLQTVQPGLAGKEIIELSTSFIFMEGRVLTYNDKVSISRPIDVDFEGVVVAKEFVKLLEKLKDEEVDISIDKAHLIVKGKKNKAGINIEKSTNIDEILDVLGKVKKWSALPATFVEGLSYCLSSVGKDMTRALLTCIHCNGNKMMSSDDVRITVFDLGEHADIEALNVPSEAAEGLRSFSPLKYATTKGWAHFKAENDAVFSCRLLTGEYAADKTMKYVEKAAEGEKFALPQGLSEALDRAGIFSTGVEIKTANDNRVRLTLADGNVTIKGEGNAGWFEETSRVRYKGDPLEFDVNPTFLQQILSHTNEVTINNRTLRFETDDFIHVILTLTPRKK